MIRYAWIALFFAIAPPASLASSNTQSAYSYQPVLNQDYIVPRVLTDPRTHIVYYLESDGRHISAIGPDGKLLWHVEPFADAKLEAYRFSHPIILEFDFPDKPWWRIHRYLGKAQDFISIGYNSSQFGALRKTDGHFFFFGQD
jgi:hypothetical protein